MWVFVYVTTNICKSYFLNSINTHIPRLTVSFNAISELRKKIIWTKTQQMTFRMEVIGDMHFVQHILACCTIFSGCSSYAKWRMSVHVCPRPTWCKHNTMSGSLGTVYEVQAQCDNPHGVLCFIPTYSIMWCCSMLLCSAANAAPPPQCDTFLIEQLARTYNNKHHN